MGLSSGRRSRGKAPVELSRLLEKHLPKRARSLVSPLSDGDREVLTYMLAFGLHLQMLAGVVLPVKNLQQKAAKVGLKHEHNVSSQSFALLSSSKSRPKLGKAKASLLIVHRTSCGCDCFSCYSSFWSRWAASPNRDLLSTIIEMAEMGEEEEERRGKENSKKQVKKNSKGENWKLHGSQAFPRRTLPSLPMSKFEVSTLKEDVMISTSMESCAYVHNILPKDVCIDEARMCMDESMSTSVVTSEYVRMDGAWIPAAALDDGSMLRDAKEGLCINDTLVMDATFLDKTSRIAASSCSDVLPLASFGQVKTCATVENNLRLHCKGKRKSNQITPLVMEEGTLVVKSEHNEVAQLGESGEGGSSPSLVGAKPRDSCDELDGITPRGVLSQVFPHTLCDIASRLWDMVSLGPRSHIME